MTSTEWLLALEPEAPAATTRASAARIEMVRVVFMMLPWSVSALSSCGRGRTSAPTPNLLAVFPRSGCGLSATRSPRLRAVAARRPADADARVDRDAAVFEAKHRVQVELDDLREILSKTGQPLDQVDQGVKVGR